MKSRYWLYAVTAVVAFCAGLAHGATSYSLPDPAVTVNPNYSNTTTIVTVAGVTYKGASQYYYVSECSQPDGARYHCNILREDNVVLKDSNGHVAVVSLTIQDASILIISGHNYWRQSVTVLSGTLSL